MQRNNVSPVKKQSGFIVLTIMLMLVLGATVFFGTAEMLRSTSMQIESQQSQIEQLHRVKGKMLSFAALFPEIYA